MSDGKSRIGLHKWRHEIANNVRNSERSESPIIGMVWIESSDC